MKKAVGLLRVLLPATLALSAAGNTAWGATPRIIAGENQTVMIRSSGTIWACGDNSLGQLGDGTTTARNVPVQVGTAADWVEIAAGMHHTVAIKADGTLWGWGDNTLGQLGNDQATLVQTTPAQIGTDTNWKSVAAGDYHTLAIKTDGTLWAWGDSEDGVLGTGETYSGIILRTPVQVGTDTNWRAVAAAAEHSLALKTDGTLWGWGSNGSTQLGDRTNLEARAPIRIGTDTDWVSVDARRKHTVAIKSSGALFAFGLNDSGQLGLANPVVDPLVPTYRTDNREVPVQVDSDLRWSVVAAGDGHTVALKTDGTLWAWGNNADGELGDGTTAIATTPKRVGNAINWVSVDAGESHTVAMNSQGLVWGMGDNSFGQLCNGTNTARLTTAPGISPTSGDIDQDGTVALPDALRALRITIGLVAPGAADRVSGDVGPLLGGVPAPDGNLTISDSLVILRKVVGLSSF